VKFEILCSATLLPILTPGANYVATTKIHEISIKKLSKQGYGSSVTSSGISASAHCGPEAPDSANASAKGSVMLYVDLKVKATASTEAGLAESVDVFFDYNTSATIKQNAGFGWGEPQDVVFGIPISDASGAVAQSRLDVKSKLSLITITGTSSETGWTGRSAPPVKHTQSGKTRFAYNLKGGTIRRILDPVTLKFKYFEREYTYKKTRAIGTVYCRATATPYAFWMSGNVDASSSYNMLNSQTSFVFRPRGYLQ
jgi:hypothetical protein